MDETQRQGFQGWQDEEDESYCCMENATNGECIHTQGGDFQYGQDGCHKLMPDGNAHDRPLTGIIK